MKEVCGITYQDYGNSKIPIIFLHGIGGDSDSFKPQLEKFRGSYRVISLNLPGYGNSKTLPNLSFEKFSDKLVEFMGALEISKAHFCGQSIGGMIALETAFRYSKHVASLALIATTPAFGGKDEGFKKEFINKRLNPLEAGITIPELAERFIPEIVGPVATQDTKRDAIASMSKVPVSTYKEIIRCLVTFNRRDNIKDLKQPCCIISGEYDTNAPSKTMYKMASLIPNSEYHDVKGAGHLVNIEAGSQTNDILSNFYWNIK